MQEFITNFIFFFAVIDPIGTVPVFIAVTSPYNEQDKRIIAVKAAMVSALFQTLLGTRFNMAGG